MKSIKIDPEAFYKDATSEKLAKALLRPVKPLKRKRFPEEPGESSGSPARRWFPDKPRSEDAV